MCPPAILFLRQESFLFFSETEFFPISCGLLLSASNTLFHHEVTVLIQNWSMFGCFHNAMSQDLLSGLMKRQEEEEEAVQTDGSGVRQSSSQQCTPPPSLVISAAKTKTTFHTIKEML